MIKRSLVLSLLVFTACGGQTETTTKKSEPAKVAEAKTPPAPTKVDAPPKVETPPPAPAPVDPATFTAADLSKIAAISKYTVNAPPGATVTADTPSFGKTDPEGAVLAKDGFKLHVWKGTIGGERTGNPIRAQADGSKYTETKNEGEKGLLEYTYEKNGKTTYGYIAAKFSGKDGSVLCGNADPVADAAALDAYRKACETLAEKK